jgi:hypothetical protein
MFEWSIRALTSWHLLPRLLLLLIVGLGIGTFLLCRHLARPHVAGQDYPSLTTLGNRDPEHLAFGGGVTLLVGVQIAIMLLAWASMRARIDEAPHTTAHNGEGRHTMNMIVLGFGVGVQFFLVLGAWVPHAYSSFNYIFSAVWLLGHVLYQLLYLTTRLLVFGLGPGLRNAHISDIVKFTFFFTCFAVEVSTISVWLSQGSHDNRLEYIAIGALILFNLGHWPEFGNLTQLRSCLDSHAIGYVRIQ